MLFVQETNTQQLCHLLIALDWIIPIFKFCKNAESAPNCSTVLQVLDVYAAMACVESLDCPALDTDALCQQWLKKVKRLQASLEWICAQQLQLRYIELQNVR